MSRKSSVTPNLSLDKEEASSLIAYLRAQRSGSLEAGEKHKVYDEDNNLVCILSPKLAAKQKVSDEALAKLRVAHLNRHNIVEKMRSLDPDDECERQELLELRDKWVEQEFELQKLWNFEPNADYHKEYRLPHCICAKMDNDDCWGTPIRYRAEGCIYHWEAV
jgi:hypothetical protein